MGTGLSEWVEVPTCLVEPSLGSAAEVKHSWGTVMMFHVLVLRSCGEP